MYFLHFVGYVYKQDLVEYQDGSFNYLLHNCFSSFLLQKMSHYEECTSVCDYIPLSQSINYRALKSDIGTACASYTTQTKQRMHAENTNYHQQL